MRSILRAVLLSLVLGVGMLSAAEVTAAQLQQLITAARAAPVNQAVQVALSVGGKPVTYSVTRDELGNIIARPIPGVDNPGVVISRIDIQTTLSTNGGLVPGGVVVVMSNNTILSYSVQVNADGTLASLYRAGSTPPGATASAGNANTNTNTDSGNEGGGGSSSTGNSGSSGGGSSQNLLDFPNVIAGYPAPLAGVGTANASNAAPQ